MSNDLEHHSLQRRVKYDTKLKHHHLNSANFLQASTWDIQKKADKPEKGLQEMLLDNAMAKPVDKRKFRSALLSKAMDSRREAKNKV